MPGSIHKTCMKKKIFETERLTLREIDRSDFNGLYEMFTDPDVMKYIADIKTEDSTHEWINLAQISYREKGYGPWAVILKDSRTLIGYCGIYLQEYIDGNNEVELLYGLKKEYWHMGFATEAAQATIIFARDTFSPDRISSARSGIHFFPEGSLPREPGKIFS